MAEERSQDGRQQEGEEEDVELDLNVPSCLHLFSAFLAMEPPHFLVPLARACGEGFISGSVQRFIWRHCINNPEVKSYLPYVKSVLKKLITVIESEDGEVIDELYEQYAAYMISLKGDDVNKGNSRVTKKISFLFPRECSEIESCPKSMKLVIPLQCSLNMLEGDTGCSIWPSSLFLSEFILSFPELFSSKSCLEVGSGTGLVGICLSHVKASTVVMSDGDMSSLANMKLNLNLNQLCASFELLDKSPQSPKRL